MKVEKISATVRYSQDTGKGAWKVIELGAPLVSYKACGTREHWCSPHNLEWKRRTKNGVTWYSHRQGKGWCSEPETAEQRR